MRFDSLVRACSRCVEKNIAPQYMASLVGKYFGPEAAVSLLKHPSMISEEPAAFALRFPVAAKSGADKVRIKLFGSFGLTINGNEIDTAVFKTRKISGIFKHILAHPGQAFSREKLATAFWPDSDGKASSNSMRVALFELRKTLASLDAAFDSEGALIAEDRNGFHVCNPGIIESDVGRFSALYDQLRSGRSTDDGGRAALCELTDLYDGDYLEDVVSEDCEVTRTHYRSVFAEASHRLAEIYESEEQADLLETLLLKHMKIDPLDEKICEMLVGLYGKTGRSRQAASLKKQFAKYFEKEMGMKPEIRQS
jgi:DNA-binding SARP family transcriptional activator